MIDVTYAQEVANFVLVATSRSHSGSSLRLLFVVSCVSCPLQPCLIALKGTCVHSSIEIAFSTIRELIVLYESVRGSGPGHDELQYTPTVVLAYKPVDTFAFKPFSSPRILLSPPTQALSFLRSALHCREINRQIMTSEAGYISLHVLDLNLLATGLKPHRQCHDGT